MAVEGLHVAFGQVVRPALRLVLFNVGQIAQEKLLGHQDAAEHLSRNRTGFQIELGHQSSMMLGEERLTSSSGGDQAVSEVGGGDLSDCILPNTSHPRIDCVLPRAFARPRSRFPLGLLSVEGIVGVLSRLRVYCTPSATGSFAS